MCGIAGILDFHGQVNRRELEGAISRMADSLVHRGPDDRGTWVDEKVGVALGFRRLAIVDLSPHGHQPMESYDGRYELVFNGEIYNCEELRKELSTLAHGAAAYRGHSDTEVMLRAFQTWGVHEALRKFVGMYAFALWDRAERVLHMARDRIGEKPLYYGWQGKAFIFGSELKALAAFPGFANGVNREALADFLRYGYIPAPESIYSGIHKLIPGTMVSLRADAEPGALEPVEYWSAREVAAAGALDPFEGTEAEAEEQLDQLLRKVVAGQMVADVPLGAFLSGGIDSSTLVGIMQALSPRPVRTFTIGFEEGSHNEAVHAKAVAKHIGTDHTELYVPAATAREVIPKLPTLYDEPFADSSQIPTFLVSELARRHVTVSISGDGGDEFFAGYTWYTRANRIWERASRMPRGVRRAGGGALKTLSPRGWDRVLGVMKPVLPGKFGRAISGDRIHKMSDVLRGANSAEAVFDGLVSFWKKGAAPVLGAKGEHTVPAMEGWDAPVTAIERLMCRDATMYLPDDILAKVDRASMGVSLESRAPFLDHRVYEFAWRLPMRMKLQNGKGKWLLRKVLDRYVPRELVERPKMGFSVPIGAWLRGPLREWAGDMLNERQMRQDGYLDAGPILKKWKEHISGDRDWKNDLWSVLMFQVWLHKSRM